MCSIEPHSVSADWTKPYALKEEQNLSGSILVTQKAKLEMVLLFFLKESSPADQYWIMELLNILPELTQEDFVCMTIDTLFIYI